MEAPVVRERPRETIEIELPPSAMAPEVGVVERNEQEIRGGLQRLERDVKIITALEYLESGELNRIEARAVSRDLTPDAAAERKDLRSRLAATLEGRAWYKQFTRLQSGDLLCCTMTPSSLDRFGMKSLNDDLIWRSQADDHIDARKQICRESFARVGIEIDEIEQGYKDGYFRIPKEVLEASPTGTGAIDVMGKIEAAMVEINTRVREDLKQRMEATRKGVEAGHRADLLDAAIAHIDDYRITLGSAEVGSSAGEGNYTHVEEAILDAQKASQFARESKDGTLTRAYSVEAIPDILDRIADLRKLLDREEIIDAEYRAVPVFIPNVDGSELNLDLVRDIRKRTFVVTEGYEQILADIEEYIGLINILDPGKKPFTHQEISGKVPIGVTGRLLSEQIALTKKLATTLRSSDDISDEDRRAIQEEITREGHDLSVTSRIEFSRQALAMPEATYLTLDILDVGPRQLAQFDRALDDVEQGDPNDRIASFQRASEIAGDEMTQTLRAFRATVNETYQQRYHDVHGDGEAPIPAMAAGGDEATIVVDQEVASPEFILALQQETQARVTKNVIGVASRDTEEDTEARKRSHIEALKRSEEATAIAKDIEKHERRIREDLRDLSESMGGPIESKLNMLRLSVQTDEGYRPAFAIVETADGSYQLLRPHAENGTESLDANDLLEEIHELQETVDQEILVACRLLLGNEHLQGTNLNWKNVRYALRYLNTNRLQVTHPAFKSFLHSMSD
jgi:hypothetical protein